MRQGDPDCVVGTRAKERRGPGEKVSQERQGLGPLSESPGQEVAKDRQGLNESTGGG